MFSSAELAAMQAAQEAAMQDKCNLCQAGEKDADAYGKKERVWIEFAHGVSCGFGYPRPSELMGKAEVPAMDGVLRLALDTDVTGLSRVELTHRFGVELSSPTWYDVVGPVQRGPSGLVVKLRMVTNG